MKLLMKEKYADTDSAALNISLKNKTYFGIQKIEECILNLSEQ